LGVFFFHPDTSATAATDLLGRLYPRQQFCPTPGDGMTIDAEQLSHVLISPVTDLGRLQPGVKTALSFVQGSPQEHERSLGLFYGQAGLGT
jgi:hypothetical protein